MEVSPIIGNIYIIHEHKTKGLLYLRKDLTFTTDSDLADKFYLLSKDNSTIANDDPVWIYTGNNLLSLSPRGTLSFVKIGDPESFITKFTMSTSGSEYAEYDTPIVFSINKSENLSLKYDNQSNSLSFGLAGNDNVNDHLFFLEKSKNKSLYKQYKSVYNSYKNVFFISALLIVLLLLYYYYPSVNSF